MVLEANLSQVNLFNVKLADLIIRPGFPGRQPLLLGAGKITSRTFLTEFWHFFLLNAKVCRNKISLFAEINGTLQSCYKWFI